MLLLLLSPVLYWTQSTRSRRAECECADPSGLATSFFPLPQKHGRPSFVSYLAIEIAAQSWKERRFAFCVKEQTPPVLGEGEDELCCCWCWCWTSRMAAVICVRRVHRTAPAPEGPNRALPLCVSVDPICTSAHRLSVDANASGDRIAALRDPRPRTAGHGRLGGREVALSRRNACSSWGPGGVIATKAKWSAMWSQAGLTTCAIITCYTFGWQPREAGAGSVWSKIKSCAAYAK